MSASIRIRYSGAVPGCPHFRARELNAMKRDAWLYTGQLYHARFTPRHFTREAYAEYAYAPRSGESGNPRPKGFWSSYAGLKQKKKGHQLPLVYSGELRAMARIRRVTATATNTRSECHVRMPQAGKANFRNPHSKIDMRAELTRVSEAEARTLVGVWDKDFQQAIGKVHDTTVVEFFHGGD